jgi:hypothetical protein
MTPPPTAAGSDSLADRRADSTVRGVAREARSVRCRRCLVPLDFGQTRADARGVGEPHQRTATAVLVVLKTPTSRSFIVREAMANSEAIARRLVPTTVERPAMELRAIYWLPSVITKLVTLTG